MLSWLRNKWQRDLVTLRERGEKERRERKILCPRCGYDVKILPDRPCSECGLLVKSVWRDGRFGAGAPLRVILVLIILYPLVVGLAPALMLALSVIFLLIGAKLATGVAERLFVLSLLAAIGTPFSIIGLRSWRYLLYGSKRWLLVYASLAAVLGPLILMLMDRFAGAGN